MRTQSYKKLTDYTSRSDAPVGTAGDVLGEGI